MKKTRKTLIAFALALFLLAAAIIATIPISFPGLESALTLRAEEMLQMPVSADGLSIRLRRGLTIKNISIGEPGIQQMTAEKIIMKANLLQLIRKRIDIESLIIERPELTFGEGEFFVPPVLPIEKQDPGTGFHFSLKQIQIRGGRVVSAHEGKPPVALADNIFIKASSVKAADEISVSARANVLKEIPLVISGTIRPIGKPEINLDAVITVPWDRLGSAAAKAGFETGKNIAGFGASDFNISLKGKPAKINIELSADMTDEEISFGKSFLKPAGARKLLSAQAELLYPRLNLQKGILHIGGNVFNMDGEFLFDDASALLQLNGKMDLADASKFIPPAADIDAAGTAGIQVTIDKNGDIPLSASGKCGIEDWRLNAAGGDSLTFEFHATTKLLRIQNINGRIGKGQLKGYGFIDDSGEYEFTIEGIDIKLEDIIRSERNNGGLRATGSAGIEASIKSSGKGIKHLTGSGSLHATDGTLKAPPGARNFLAAANLAGLTPIKYDRIRANFLIQSGVLNADAFLKSDKLEIRTEKAELDFVKMEKRIYADLLLSPAFVESGRQSLGNLDSLLFLDERGFAHIGLVWNGDMAETSPDMTASLIRTGQKKLRERLRR